MHILIVEDNPDLVANLADFPSLCLSSHLAAVICQQNHGRGDDGDEGGGFSIQLIY